MCLDVSTCAVVVVIIAAAVVRVVCVRALACTCMAFMSDLVGHARVLARLIVDPDVGVEEALAEEVQDPGR